MQTAGALGIFKWKKNEHTRTWHFRNLFSLIIKLISIEGAGKLEISQHFGAGVYFVASEEIELFILNLLGDGRFELDLVQLN